MIKKTSLRARRRKRRCIVIDEAIPFRAERALFVEHLQKLGWNKHTVRTYELRLAEFASRIDIYTAGGVTQAQIEQATQDWLQKGRFHLRTKPDTNTHSLLFVRCARQWLRFLNRLHIVHPPHYSIISGLEQFLDQERGLSHRSIQTISFYATIFLAWLTTRQRQLRDVSIKDVDLFLASERPRSWNRVTISICAFSLRSFFRYATKVGLCTHDVANGIDAPRLYSQAGLPRGPSWLQVRRLIASIGRTSRADIRDRAIIILFALYGFRLGEVCSLHLESFDWQREQIVVTRGKQYEEHLYPLVREAGDAILLYLQKVRPRSTHRQLFLSHRVPFLPLTTGGVTTIVQRRMRSLGETLPHFGPHSLRHACATHLLSEGFSLKEIGDHLGHRDQRSTQVYAKVDLKGLKEVARLSLGGLI